MKYHSVSFVAWAPRSTYFTPAWFWTPGRDFIDKHEVAVALCVAWAKLPGASLQPRAPATFNTSKHVASPSGIQRDLVAISVKVDGWNAPWNARREHADRLPAGAYDFCDGDDRRALSDTPRSSQPYLLPLFDVDTRVGGSRRVCDSRWDARFSCRDNNLRRGVSFVFAFLPPAEETGLNKCEFYFGHAATTFRL